jgi:hypothetical protein
MHESSEYYESLIIPGTIYFSKVPKMILIVMRAVHQGDRSVVFSPYKRVLSELRTQKHIRFIEYFDATRLLL